MTILQCRVLSQPASKQRRQCREVTAHNQQALLRLCLAQISRRLLLPVAGCPVGGWPCDKLSVFFGTEHLAEARLVVCSTQAEAEALFLVGSVQGVLCYVVLAMCHTRLCARCAVLCCAVLCCASHVRHPPMPVMSLAPPTASRSPAAADHLWPCRSQTCSNTVARGNRHHWLQEFQAC